MRRRPLTRFCSGSAAIVDLHEMPAAVRCFRPVSSNFGRQVLCEGFAEGAGRPRRSSRRLAQEAKPRSQDPGPCKGYAVVVSRPVAGEVLVEAVKGLGTSRNPQKFGLPQ